MLKKRLKKTFKKIRYKSTIADCYKIHSVSSMCTNRQTDKIDFDALVCESNHSLRGQTADESDGDSCVATPVVRSLFGLADWVITCKFNSESD